MENDRIRIAATAAGRFRELDADQRDLAMLALERIDEDPLAGAPLFEPWRGVWSYRSGPLRVLYRLSPEARLVIILSITLATEPAT